MNEILIPSNKSRGEIISTVYDLAVGQKAYFNMFQEGGACIVRTKPELWCLYSIPLYGGTEGFEMSGDIEDVKRMVETALSWT